MYMPHQILGLQPQKAQQQQAQSEKTTSLYPSYYYFSMLQVFDTARAEGWFIGEMIWNFAGNTIQ